MFTFLSAECLPFTLVSFFVKNGLLEQCVLCHKKEKRGLAKKLPPKKKEQKKVTTVVKQFFVIKLENWTSYWHHFRVNKS